VSTLPASRHTDAPGLSESEGAFSDNDEPEAEQEEEIGEGAREEEGKGKRAAHEEADEADGVEEAEEEERVGGVADDTRAERQESDNLLAVALLRRVRRLRIGSIGQRMSVVRRQRSW
jgi:hypothetical protein